MDVATAVRLSDGVARTGDLRRLGCTAREIASAVASREVLRLRVGWYGLPDLPEPIARAHRVGGRPACATVAQVHGLWMLAEPLLHIEVDPGGNGFRSQLDPARRIGIRDRDDVVVHWRRGASTGSRRGQPLVDALCDLTTCLPRIEAVATVDSALHAGVVRLDSLRSRAGSAAQKVLALCDPTAESGVESIFRVRARAAGWDFRSQVQVPGGRVDFLFGDRLIVEVDGSEFHAGREAFVADRERDAWHAAIGYRVIRLTYAQVIHRWHEVESLLRLLHARGEHRAPIRTRA